MSELVDSDTTLPEGLPASLGGDDAGYHRLCLAVRLTDRNAKNRFAGNPVVKNALKRLQFRAGRNSKTAERHRRMIITFYGSPSARSSVWHAVRDGSAEPASLEDWALREYDSAYFDQEPDQEALSACKDFFDVEKLKDDWRRPALTSLPAVRSDLESWANASDDRQRVIASAAFAVASVLEDVRLLRWAAGLSPSLAEEFRFAADTTLDPPNPLASKSQREDLSDNNRTKHPDAREALNSACETLIKATNDLMTGPPSATLFASVARSSDEVERLQVGVLKAHEADAHHIALIAEIVQLIAARSEALESLEIQCSSLQTHWEEAFPLAEKHTSTLEEHAARVRHELQGSLDELSDASEKIRLAQQAATRSGTDRERAEAYGVLAREYNNRQSMRSALLAIILPNRVKSSNADDTSNPNNTKPSPRTTDPSDQHILPPADANLDHESTEPTLDSSKTQNTIALASSNVPVAPPSTPSRRQPPEPSKTPPENTNIQTASDLSFATDTGQANDVDSSPTLPPRTQAAAKAVWRAIRDDQMGIAYHVLQRQSDPESVDILPPISLVVASALARHVFLSHGTIVERYQSELEMLTDMPPNDTTAQDIHHLLLLEATLRAALLAPKTSALELLSTVKFSEPLAPVTEFAKRWSDKCRLLQSTTLNVHRLQSTFASVNRQSQIERLEEQVRDAVKHAASRRIPYTPALRVWKHWINDGILHDIGDDFNTSPAPNRSRISEIVKSYDDPRRFKVLVRDSIQGAKKRSKKVIDDQLYEHLRRTLSPIIDHLREWQSLATNNGNQEPDFIDQNLRALSVILDNGIDATEALLSNSMSLGIYATISRLLSTSKSLRTVFHGESIKTSNDFIPVDVILSRDLLLLPPILLDTNYHILNDKDASNHLTDNAASVASDLQEAFTLRLEAGDIVGAYLVREWLAEEGDIAEDQCMRMLEQSIHEKWSKEEKRRKELVASVERSFARRQIDTTIRDSLAASVADPVREEVPLLMKAIHRFDGVESELLMHRNNSINRMKDGLKDFANKLETLDAEQRSQLDVAIEHGDVVVFDEFKSRLESGDSIIGPEQDQDRFADFRHHAREIEKSIGASDKPSIEDIDVAATKRESIAGLSFSSDPSVDAPVPSQLLRPWYQLARHRSIELDPLRQLFQELGFLEVETEKRGNNVVTMSCKPLTDRTQCPLHVYGSQARDRAAEARAHYAIILSWPPRFGPAKDSLIQLMDNPREHAIVLHFGSLRDDRFALREWLMFNRRRFIVLDETLLRYLSTVGAGRLRAFFDCSLPFTSVDPFVTTASLVPPELFYGRANEKAQIVRQTGSCFVYGGRQLGKTALLRSAEDEFSRLGDRYRAKWVDLKHNEIGSGRDSSQIWVVLWKALQEIDVIENDRRAPSGRDRLRDAFGNAVEEWIGATGRLLLLLDEADEFLRLDAYRDFPESTMLKGIMDKTERRFKVVFAGLHNVLRTTERANHPLAHLGEPICVGPLLPNGEWREAQKLLEQPLASIGYRFKDRRAVLHVLAQTNYFPSLIQLFGAEFVRYLRDTKNFPYVADVDDVVNVFNRRELRDAIRQRFMLTLQLDERYVVVALAMAFEFAGDSRAIEDGLDRDMILDSVVQHWEEGFGDLSVEGFDVLLQEMEGLGVLRRIKHRTRGSAHYTLRNPNILVLLGSQVEIGQRLEKQRQLPRHFEPASFRAVYGSSRAPTRHGMLTFEQERRLRDSRVSVIVGSEAVHMADIQEFFAARLDDDSLRVLNPAATQLEFEQEIAKSRPRRDRPRVWLVPASAGWNVRWIGAAFGKLQEVQLGDFIRVILVADPQKLWAVLRDEDHSEMSDEQLRWFVAGPWDTTFLRRWCEEQNLSAEREQVDSLMDKSGGWPVLLEQYDTSPSIHWEKKIQLLDRLVVDTSVALMRSLGIDTAAQDQLTQLLSCEDERESDINVLFDIDSDQLSVLRSRLVWAKRLGFVTDTSGLLQFNPLVKRLISPSAMQ